MQRRLGNAEPRGGVSDAVVVLDDQTRRFLRVRLCCLPLNRPPREGCEGSGQSAPPPGGGIFPALSYGEGGEKASLGEWGDLW